jgi:uncharacterized protein
VISDVKVILIPGLFDSGPNHWQSIWQRQHPEYLRVVQRDWETPACSDWVRELERVIAAAGSRTVLAAHSLACATVAHWAMSHSRPILGALLVAPSDVEAPSYPPGSTGFEPMPLGKLPFQSMVVASNNDPYVTPERARKFAASWGSEFVEIGAAGHINADSGHGPWPQGGQLLQKLVERC